METDAVPGAPRDPAETLRATYDQIVPEYTAANRTLLPEWAQGYLSGFVAAARAVGDATRAPRALDLGCGPGRDMAELERQGLAVIGADLSRGMLNEARRNVSGPLVEMDMRALAFRGGAFHGAWCNAALLHIPRVDAPAVLRDLAALLVPKAPLFLTMQGGSGETWEATAYGKPLERFFARYSRDEVVALLSSAGFTVELESDSRAVDPAGRHWLRFLAKRRT